MASSSFCAGQSCPIRVVAVHLLDAAGQLLRILFLDQSGRICSEPHYMPQPVALTLAANERQILGPQAEVRVF